MYIYYYLPTLHGTYVHATFASNQGSIGRYLCYEDIYIHKLVTHTRLSSTEIADSIVLKSVSNIFSHQIFLIVIPKFKNTVNWVHAALAVKWAAQAH